jgi:hypothetical protein
MSDCLPDRHVLSGACEPLSAFLVFTGDDWECRTLLVKVDFQLNTPQCPVLKGLEQKSHFSRRALQALRQRDTFVSERRHKWDVQTVSACSH